MLRRAVVLAIVLLAIGGLADAQGVAEDAEIVWTCPLHREVTETRAGSCPICERELTRTLIKQAYSCPLHAVVSEPEPGSCPICERELYLISEEVRFSCPMHQEVASHAPGACPICNMALVPETATRPHQDHNPKHGGMFFMAPDSWHHLEGTYPEPGVFRVYLFNNFSEPLDAGAFRGRAVVEEVFDAQTRETRELRAFPLAASSDGGYLEARVGDDALPREITAKVQFEPGAGFERFDFVFADLTVDATFAPAPAEWTESTDRLAVPNEPGAMVLEIAKRSAVVRELVAAGALNEIYLPALEAKDLAVALEAHIGARAEDERRELTWALKQLVRSAWLLDDYGDLGNREKVNEAFALFDEAVERIRSLY